MSDLEEMNEMSPSARALLDEVRDLDGPAPGDRDRVKRALVATIASTAGLAATTVASGTAAAGTTAAATATAGGLTLGVKIAAVAFVAAALGGTALVVTQSDEPDPAPAARHVATAPASDPEILRPPPRVAPVAAPVDVPVEEPIEAPLEEAVEAPAPVAVPSPTREEATPAPRARRRPSTPREIITADSTLTEEIALIRDAQRAIQAERAPAALRHLDAHARRFPHGVLEEEREAARVVALCQSGQAEEARRLAQRFLHERPNSPHRARVAGACP